MPCPPGPSRPARWCIPWPTTMPSPRPCPPGGGNPSCREAPALIAREGHAMGHPIDVPCLARSSDPAGHGDSLPVGTRGDDGAGGGQRGYKHRSRGTQWVATAPGGAHSGNPPTGVGNLRGLHASPWKGEGRERVGMSRRNPQASRHMISCAPGLSHPHPAPAPLKLRRADLSREGRGGHPHTNLASRLRYGVPNSAIGNRTRRYSACVSTRPGVGWCETRKIGPGPA